MAAANLDILIEQGATFSRTLTIEDSNGAPIDLTGWTFVGKIRALQEDSSAIGTFSFTILNQVTNKGQVTWSMSATNTLALPAVVTKSYQRVNYYSLYDINATHADGSVERILQGTCQISPEVSR